MAAWSVICKISDQVSSRSIYGVIYGTPHKTLQPEIQVDFEQFFFTHYSKTRIYMYALYSNV